MAVKTREFKISNYLKTNEDWAFFLNDALETNDAAYIAHTLGEVAKAKGMAGVAKAAHLSRENLYRSLSEKGNPEFDTILKVFQAVGLQLVVAPVATKKLRRAQTTAKKRKAA